MDINSSSFLAILIGAIFGIFLFIYFSIALSEKFLSRRTLQVLIKKVNSIRIRILALRNSKNLATPPTVSSIPDETRTLTSERETELRSPLAGMFD